MVFPWLFPDDTPYHADQHRPERGITDGRLTALVTRQLRNDETTGQQRISVTVHDRVVILSGIVDDPEVRRSAGELAWKVPGVFDVCNTLRPPRWRLPRG